MFYSISMLLGFLGEDLHTHNITCARKLDFAYIGLFLCAWAAT